MIPKIIHYVWLGNAPIPDDMQKCLDSWKVHLPDYKLMLWDENSIDRIDSVFIREAIAEKKYAFASDVIRLYAIYHYGGVYMDTDVMVYKSFDSLLDNHAFIGRENSVHQKGRSFEVYLTTCCFGAEKGNAFIKRCLDHYNGRSFVTSPDRSLPIDCRLDTRLNSFLFCVYAKEIGFKSDLNSDFEQHCDENLLTVYPQRFFDATKVTSDMYTKHLALGTWREGKGKVWTYTLKDKIAWRVEAVARWILNKFGYMLIKK